MFKLLKKNGITYDKGCIRLTGVVACTCNPATLKAEFWSGVASIPVGGNSPSIDGWIVWPPIFQH